jgi:transglutaminase-like putative cysteine protease
MINTLPRQVIPLTLTGFGCGVLLHADRTPAWCVAIATFALLWRGLHALGRIPLPGTLLRIALTLALVLTVVAFFRSISGLAAGSALLMVMGAAKLLETRQSRDAAVVAMVSLVLLLAACLDRQSLLRVPLYLGSGWIAMATFSALGGGAPSANTWRAFAISGRALLLALPVGILCFVFVPRLPGALWSMPGSERAQTGLGDEMSPGSISELSVSDDIAFRVQFSGPAPAPQERYWRGPVLHDFDGYTWRRRPGQVAVRQPTTPASAAIRYRVMLEPHGRLYLFGLDAISELTGRRNFQTFDGQVNAARPVTTAISYQGVSHLRLRHTAALSLTGRRLDTRLPANRNPRSVALAQQLRVAAGSDRAYVAAVLEYFRAAGFQYTLTPPLLDYNSVDDLIFNTRLGFCGHFASAYVTLMRAAGIPARVVTGYMGAAWNPVGGYYVVRQSDAHAWAEVWLETTGWQRVDPTAVVAPERLQRGLRDILPETGGATDRLLRGAPWLRDLADSWDAANNWWQERVVNFNLALQRDFLARLGMPDIDYRGLALLLASGIGVWLALLFRQFTFGTRRPRPDALLGIWSRYAALLKSRGIEAAPHEGARAIAVRAGQRLPAAALALATFTELYQRLRFGQPGAGTTSELTALRRHLDQIARATAAARRR